MGALETKTGPTAAAQKQMLVREMLDRVGDKWTLLVIEERRAYDPRVSAPA